jgi:thioredoxin-like negative regulator of GroEL
MDAEVYTNESVIQAMTKVLPVRIDVDKQPAVARKYALAGMPMLVFADSYGNELFRFTGTLTVPIMLQLMKELPGDVTKINRLSQILAKDKDHFDTLADLGRELRGAGFWRSSNRYYGAAMRIRARPEQAHTRGEILMAMGHNHLELKEFSDAGKVFERYLRDFGDGPAEAEAMLGLGRALLYQNKRDEAKRMLQALRGKYTSGGASNEAARLLVGL